MKILNGKTKWEDNQVDSEVIDLCDAINSLPGIFTTESCCGHGKTFFKIFFKVHGSMEGLFFLVRSADCRYWRYGHLWNISLDVGDLMTNNVLPVCFLLSSREVGRKAYAQAQDLIRNMNLHLNHKAFINHYNLDLSKFKTSIVRK